MAAGTSVLDTKMTVSAPAKIGMGIFGVALVVGLVYAGTHLLRDLSGVQTTSALPFILLGVALLTALAFRIRQRLPRHRQRRRHRDLHPHP